MGPQKYKTGHVTYPHPFQGRYVVHMLGLAMIDLCSKLKISMFTHYEDIKATKNAEIGVVLGLGVTRGHRQHNHSIEYIRLPIRLCVYFVPFSSYS